MDEPTGHIHVEFLHLLINKDHRGRVNQKGKNIEKSKPQQADP